jgi:gliding motility-associated-like protein
VNPVNDAPVANNDSGVTLSETPITISIINNLVLSGKDTDIEGNNTIVLSSIDLDPSIPGLQTTLIVRNVGTYTANANGTITFIPDPSNTGFTSTITYTILDNAGAVSNQASITIVVGACIDNPDIDCDNDGLTNAEESTIGTDPSNPDTDGDGVLDGTEVIDGTKPLEPCDAIEEHVVVAQSILFLSGDCDSDGLNNGEEIGPSPTNPLDSDGDGIPDYLEPNRHTPSEDELEIFNFISPNSNSQNDVFVIRNIELYPDNSVEIYNRWGVLVYSVKSYGQNDNFFRGYSKGRVTIEQNSLLPDGTYFYVLKYKNSQGIYKDRAGYLYISSN